MLFVCSVSQYHSTVRKLQPPEELCEQLRSFSSEAGHAVFLWVPEKQRLVGVFTQEDPVSAEHKVSIAGSQSISEACCDQLVSECSNGLTLRQWPLAVQLILKLRSCMHAGFKIGQSMLRRPAECLHTSLETRHQQA